ncbi:MAG: HAMP domain-containing histidine kinase [Bacteroidetes bacterium]|nr:HAMP domain-containing histidine kinase [Bacteroidota bacterium]
MNPRRLVLLIIILSLSLCGLLGIQLYWIRHTLAIREVNFRRSVNEALSEVVFQAELFGKQHGTKGGIKKGSSIGYSIFRPVEEQLSEEILGSIIRKELSQKGIDTRFEFGVFSPKKKDFVIKKATVGRNDLIKKGYAVTMFPDELFASPNYLIVYFPHEKSFLLSQLGGLFISSFLLIGIIAYAFYYAVMTIFRQKRLSEMKNDFINNMTHEFKTPISTISLACEALRDKEVSKDVSFYNTYVGIIHEENRRLAIMAEKILQTAVIDKGQLKLKKELFDIHQVIDEVIRNIGIQVEIKDGEIIRDYRAVRKEVFADRVHIINAIYNLLDNANKYSPKKPQIRVVTENNESRIIVAIEDKGIGISTSDQKRLFEKLYRIPTGNIHDVRGFGLGLSYVKAIVEKHGGEVGMESELNKGSKFWFSLPMDEQTENE